MKPALIVRITTVSLIAAIGFSLGWSGLQSSSAAPAPALSHFVPAGALLYLQAKDFSALLADWNRSPQKQEWVGSDNYEVFSRSRLLLRMKDAGRQFSAAAGLPPDMNFLTQAAGDQTAFALYDIGKLQFLYITRLPPANSTQNQLWQTRSKFERRKAADTAFYLRRDPESGREVEFALAGDYLLLATREDLMAGALALMAGSRDAAIESEAWWAQSVAAGGEPGDLRMVLNLDKIVNTPYFRSYWIQQNVTEMKQYVAAISDLFRSAREYREERILIKRASANRDTSLQTTAPADQGLNATSGLMRLVPEDAGFYEVRANPSAESCLALLQNDILAPHPGAAPVQQIAPQVQLTSDEAGSDFDLETRIDQAPAPSAGDMSGSAGLKEMLRENPAVAVLQVWSSGRDQAGVLVNLRMGVVLAGSAPWDEAGVRNRLAGFVRSGLTAGQMGASWRQVGDYYELDGLLPLQVAVRGKYLVIADNSSLISEILAKTNQKPESQPALLMAGFNHSSEGANFARLTQVLDRPDAGVTAAPGTERQPPFFSGNLAGLSSTLSSVSSEKIVVRDTGDKILQTVTYQWAR